MKYKTFIKNSLQSNDIKSLKKYDKLTQKLAKKDKKFSKYLLSSNQNLIKQYGGGDLVKVEQGDKKYKFDVKNFYGEFPKFIVGESESKKYVNNVTGRTFDIGFPLIKEVKDAKTYKLQNKLHYEIFRTQGEINLHVVIDNTIKINVIKIKYINDLKVRDKWSESKENMINKIIIPDKIKYKDKYVFNIKKIISQGTSGVICLYELQSDELQSDELVEFCLKIEKDIKNKVSEIEISDLLRMSDCHTLDVRHIPIEGDYNYYIMNALKGDLTKLMEIINLLIRIPKRDNQNRLDEETAKEIKLLDEETAKEIKLFIAQQVHDQIKCIFYRPQAYRPQAYRPQAQAYRPQAQAYRQQRSRNVSIGGKIIKFNKKVLQAYNKKHNLKYKNLNKIQLVNEIIKD